MLKFLVESGNPHPEAAEIARHKNGDCLMRIEQNNDSPVSPGFRILSCDRKSPLSLSLLYSVSEVDSEFEAAGLGL